MTEEIFVARERELYQLERVLGRALAGQGQLVFVTGEVGTGKTTLVKEFIRRAQLAHTDLIIAQGNCKAQTGVGDPYLPFREVLALLAGEVEAKLVRGIISPENASRLQNFFPMSGKALLDFGPNLINIFVSQADLVSRAEEVLADEANWLDRLKEVTTPGTGTELTQELIFEQYTDVLQALAAQRPLVVWLEDVHWADRSSINLLRHLGQCVIEEDPILIVGTYRLEETSPASGGEQHPLTEVVDEFESYLGEIRVDLGEAAEIEGLEFVQAFIDTEPNRLGEAFRLALFQHTGGHPLFTAELWRELQERGALIQDDAGQWVEGSTLDWETLPVGIDGVIEKRLDRLEAELRQILAVASVEGEEFTAEVVARTQAVDEQVLARQLRDELEQQHRLISSRGSQRVGSDRLSLYQFRHNVIQKYLYYRLDKMERARLHEKVGNALEELYGQQAEEIAGQLAWHFQEAGIAEKTVEYLRIAGDAAARTYANAEAVVHYTHALEVAQQAEVSSEQLLHLYTRRGRALELSDEFDQALSNYQQMEKLARSRGDRHLELSALVALGTVRSMISPVYDLAQGQAVSEQALTLARELDDQQAEAKVLWNLGSLCFFSGRLHESISYGERALALARQLNLTEQVAQYIHDLYRPYGVSGQIDRAKALLREATALWRELGNLPMLADSLASSSLVWTYAGSYDPAIVFSEEALQISQSINNLWGQTHSQSRVGYVYWERGQPDRAIAVMKESIRLSKLSDLVTPQAATQADLAAVYGSLGAIEQGLATARLALTVAETQVEFYEGYVLGILAQLQLLSGNLAEAEAIIERGKAHPSREAMPLFFLNIPLVEVELALRRGNYEQAVAVSDALLADLRQFGTQAYIPDVLYLQSQARQALGQEQAARDCLLEARSAAQAIGSRRSLWPILLALSELESDLPQANALRQEAREIVDYIAEHIDSAELRTSFLNLPFVQKALGAESKAVSLLRKQLQRAHQLLEASLDGITSQQAHWVPPGTANPVGATYAYAIIAEDKYVNEVLKEEQPLFMTTDWAGKVGLSELPPSLNAKGPDFPDWTARSRSVQVDLAALREYARAVFAATDTFLASLTDQDLNRSLDLNPSGLVEQTIGQFLNEAVLENTYIRCGEIYCLKRLQETKG